MKFEEFQKIARLKRECFISEKIDGTNAQVLIVPLALEGVDLIGDWRPLVIAQNDTHVMFAGSRTQYVTLERDNHGFAKWVKSNADALWTLGDGHHYGEWWGNGIQRGYGLANGDKRFSLFNVWRWNDDNPNRPACCGVVPNLYTGPFTTDATAAQIERLKTEGSFAAPGFRKPEGIVIYLSAARTYFKQTLEKDDEWKGKALAVASRDERGN